MDQQGNKALLENSKKVIQVSLFIQALKSTINPTEKNLIFFIMN